MSLTKQDTLRVPGAHLAYEVRGEGPLLLMIAGGGGEGGGFTGIADHLAEQYTVVTYDRRGAGRSTLDDPQADMSVQMHSNDAHTLLAALTTEPALVFGSSAGALIGLDLVVRYPQQVRLLVAHEPAAPGDLACFRSGPGAPSGDLSARGSTGRVQADHCRDWRDLRAAGSRRRTPADQHAECRRQC